MKERIFALLSVALVLVTVLSACATQRIPIRARSGRQRSASLPACVFMPQARRLELRLAP